MLFSFDKKRVYFPPISVYFLYLFSAKLNPLVVQGFVLKYLLFSPEETSNVVPNNFSNLAIGSEPNNVPVSEHMFSSLTEEKKSRS